MKNIFKKITVAIMSLVLTAGVFAPVSSVFAATFNTDAKDYATLRVSNYTTNPESNMHWSNSVSANAGEVVSFLVYYHNTAADTANGTTVRVQLPSGAFTSATITGTVGASNASAVTGTASVNLTSNQTMTLIPGSVKWYPNKTLTAQTLLNGQNGSEIVSANGLSLGSITGGWPSQGQVVFRAQVNNGGGNGGGSVASVTTNSASAISQNNATLNGSVNPNNSNTNVWFEYGTTQSFGNTAGNQTIASSNSASAITGYAYNLAPNTTYYYRAVGQNASGTTYGNTLSFTTLGNGGGNNNGSVVSVTTNSAYSIYQNSATLQGSVNPNNSNATAWFEYGTTQSFGNTVGTQSVGSGSVSTSITSYVSNLSSNTTYYYRAVGQNSYGTTYGNTLSFTTLGNGGGNNNGSVAFVTTNPATAVAYNNATLQGSVNPNNSNTSVWFEYGTTQSFGNTAGSQTLGSSNYTTTITGYAYNLAPNTTYYYRAVGQNSSGTTYGNTLNFTTQSSGYNNNGNTPLVYTNAASSVTTNSTTFNGSVNPNNSYANAWFEYGMTQSLGYTTGYQAVGSSNYATTLTGSVTSLASNTTYYYRAVAQNSYGTTYGNTLSFTTGGSSVNTSGIAPYVTTRAAQSVFRNSALIDSSVNPNGSLGTSWFDWGATTAFGSRTIIRPIGQANYADNHSAILSGLNAGTTYYYRAVAQNAYGTTYGNTLTLTTTADSIVPVVINNPTPVQPRVIVQQTASGVAPTVTLTPSIDKKNPRGGDEIEYTIQYRNEMASPITNVTLRVELPSEVTYDTATLKPSVSTDNSVTFDLGTITANTQGVITIKAIVNRTIDAEDTLIFGATINYTNARNQFQSATAYLTVLVGSGVAGLASLISVFGNLFSYWFVDLILGLLIGFGIYHFFVRQKEEDVLVK
ncbi:MAG: hypothetical protein UT41_C0001G0419 [Candidatus Wolfebacteria bacterium GW2011_GWC2_39_22]|uniref:DUF11 domain-containing protein n=1 Tax=Candidatus Wolfebacteria bacterium GW2011_GWC2_39_22 TaxID=1619013 RepID=A0A0G0QR58_9BACT|nr:MAG: hypothetical protein UT41_C0001G0419 [Candidatus Wolfebacteria bacterium GW2011_GWC2_39_22]